MKKILALVLAVSLLFGITSCATNNRSVSALLADAEELFEDGEYSDAVDLFLEVVDLDEEEAEGYIGAAKCYLEQGKDERARRILEKGYKATKSARIAEMLENLDLASDVEEIEETNDLIDGYIDETSNIPDLTEEDSELVETAEPVNLDESLNELVQSLPDLDVTKKIIWLSWYEIDETSPATELFKAKYGVPDMNSASGGDKVFEYRKVAYENRYYALAKDIQSGDSPDIFQFEIRNYPYAIYQNLFQPIDGVIDLNAPEWQDNRDLIEAFKWGEKNYCAVTELVPSYFLWYRKSVVENAGLEDPYTLYTQGRWDWNAFLDMAERFSDPANDKYFISGWEPDDSILCATGKGLITLENGQLINNSYSPEIERAMEVVKSLASNNYRYPHHELNDWSMNYNEFRHGNILFWDNGQWFYGELLSKYRDKDGWADDEICLVPYPRDLEADRYYQMGKQDAYMFVAGSQNEAGFKAWTECCLLASKSPEAKLWEREKMKINDGWTNVQLDVLDEAVRNLTPVFDFKNGIGDEVGYMGVYETPVQMTTKYVYIHDMSYVQMRAENEGVINVRIRELNESVVS